MFPFFPQFFKKLDYIPRSGLYDAVNCTVHASDLRKYDKRINKLNEHAVVDVARNKLAQVSGLGIKVKVKTTVLKQDPLTTK